MSALLQPGAPVPELEFRAMREHDLPAVLDLERSAYPYPWTEGILRDCLLVGYDCRVMELAHVLVGYSICSAGAGEAHLLNLCVREQFRGRGLGRRLLLQAMQRAAAAGARVLFLETRPSNVAAVRLYQTMNFVQIGVRRGYYQAETGREDALVLRRALDDVGAGASQDRP